MKRYDTKTLRIDVLPSQMVPGAKLKLSAKAANTLSSLGDQAKLELEHPVDKTRYVLRGHLQCEGSATLFFHVDDIPEVLVETTNDGPRSLALLLNQRGGELYRHRRFNEALAHFHCAVDTLRKDPDQKLLASMLINLGGALGQCSVTRLGTDNACALNPENGSALSQQSLAAFEEALSLQLKFVPAGHPELARSLQLMGVQLKHLKRFPESEACFEKAIRIMRHYVSRLELRKELALFLSNFADLCYQAKQLDKAKTLLVEAETIAAETNYHQLESDCTRLRKRWFPEPRQPSTMPMEKSMDQHEWKRFILDWSKKVEAQDLEEHASERRTIDPEHGYGAPGASDGAIADAEKKLGTTLPQSYKEFLKASNGLKQPIMGMPATGGDFWPVEEIDWLRVRNQEWIDVWGQADETEVSDEEYFVYGPDQDSCLFRTEYVSKCLEISHDGDAGIYLLNPEIKDSSGEWEAWHLASWMPGATRYRSFQEMLKAHYAELERSGKDDSCCGF
jgi:tetratricopeptide (TPR) repeat protein